MCGHREELRIRHQQGITYEEVLAMTGEERVLIHNKKETKEMDRTHA